MEKLDIRGRFNDTEIWEPYMLGDVEIQVRKKLTAKEIEDAAWEIASHVFIVDEESGSLNSRVDEDFVELWVFFKYCTNVDMDVFGDIETGLQDFVDALPQAFRLSDFLKKYPDIGYAYQNVYDAIHSRVLAKYDLGKRLLKAFGSFLGDGDFAEEAMKAQGLSETLIALMEKAKGYDNITGAMKTKKTMPVMPEGLAKKIVG